MAESPIGKYTPADVFKMELFREDMASMFYNKVAVAAVYAMYCTSPSGSSYLLANYGSFFHPAVPPEEAEKLRDIRDKLQHSMEIWQNNCRGKILNP